MADPASVALSFLHLLFALLWVGGTYFFYRVFQPGLAILPLELQRKVNQRVGGRVVLLTWLAVAGVAATGLASASLRGTLALSDLAGTLRGQLLLAEAGVFVAAALLARRLAKTLPILWKEPSMEGVKSAQVRVAKAARIQLCLLLGVLLLEAARAGL
ncbi:MAG: hypothetical protein QXO51_00850 [Halobacteria archaeon]